MKYRSSITIELPRERVIELFDDPKNMPKWQPGLISFEPLSGTPGQPGAKSTLKYKMGKREVVLIETIIKRDLPNEFSGTYEAPDMWNRVSNYFKEDGPSRTLWITDHEFRFSGFTKVMSWFIPGVFKKQSKKFAMQFKEFAEREGA